MIDLRHILVSDMMPDKSPFQRLKGSAKWLTQVPFSPRPTKCKNKCLASIASELPGQTERAIFVYVSAVSSVENEHEGKKT